MRHPGFVSAEQAAARLLVSKRTVLFRCHQAFEDDLDEDEVWFPGVQQTATGRFLIPVEDVDKLRPKRRDK